MKIKRTLLLVFFFLLVLTSCTNNPNDKDPVTPDTPDIPEVKDNYGNILDYMTKDGGIPLIKIKTDEGKFPQDKENYVDGTLEIVEEKGSNKVIFDKADMGVRLRGNSTLECPKKAFRIKFDKKQSLFELPAAKSWVLLANYFDKSNIRNYLAYLTAHKLDNLYFQPSCIFVEVEFNGDYLGLYLLCEQMQTGEGRVDIEQDEYDDTNGSYFMELDFEDRILADGLVKNVSYFESNGLFYALKYPEDDDATYQRCLYIKSFMDTVFMKMKNKTDYDSVMDVESFIDYYLIQELFKNVDSIQSSVYYYVENKMLYAGPVWDFDIALGVVGKNDRSWDYAWYEEHIYWVKEESKFYNTLFKDSRFLNRVKARYTEVRPILWEIFEEIELLETYLQEEFERNEMKWEIPGDLGPWIANRYATEYEKIKTTYGHIKYVELKLMNQFYYLDELYLIK